MSYLYINENGANISVEESYVKVAYKDGLMKKIPIETLDSIQIFSKANMTTPCTIECMKREIVVAYYSKSGSYFGRLESTGHINVERQRQQCRLYNTDFSLNLGKKIISAKIHNQKVILKRYLRNSRKTLDEEIKMLKIQEEKVCCAKNVNQIMGYEGIAARYYFQGLSQLIDKQFAFTGRNRRPPKDEFNSMISLGYSILMNEYYGKIVAHGLNPYFGFIHSDKERHPILVSDLIEEWRAVIVDSLVMSLINGHEILKEHFAYGIDNPGIYLTTDGMKIFLNKYDKKIRTEVKYYEDESSMPFRRAMDIQIGKLVHAIEDEDITLYEPFKIR